MGQTRGLVDEHDDERRGRGVDLSEMEIMKTGLWEAAVPAIKLGYD